VNLEADTNNNIRMTKLNSPNNTLRFRRRAAGATAQTIDFTLSDTVFVCVAMTWSDSGDALKAYFQGAQGGSTLTGLATWAGALAAATSVIGAQNTSAGNPWSGSVAHVALWDAALSAGEIAALGAV